MNNSTYYISRKFAPGRSPLGRILARRLGDRLRLEGVLLLTTIVGVVILIAIQYLTWAAFSTEIVANPTGSTAILFWTSQIVATASFLYLTLFGFSSAHNISVTPHGLQVRTDGIDRTIPWADVESVEIIDSNVYQKHYRRYADTITIGVVASPTTLLVNHVDGPIVLALSHVDLNDFSQRVRAYSISESLIAPAANVTA